MRLRMLLESLRKRNRVAGIPDDRASADIEAASLAVVTAETLHRLIANTPAVAGMGRQFVAEVRPTFCRPVPPLHTPHPTGSLLTL